MRQALILFQPYPGRTPYIQVKVKKKCVCNGMKDAKQRDNVTIDFAKIKDSKLGELTANFDIILGITPDLD